MSIRIDNPVVRVTVHFEVEQQNGDVTTYDIHHIKPGPLDGVTVDTETTYPEDMLGRRHKLDEARRRIDLRITGELLPNDAETPVLYDVAHTTKAAGEEGPL